MGQSQQKRRAVLIVEDERGGVETRVTHPADAVRARKQSYYCTAANGSKVPSKAASAKSHSMTSSAAGNQCGRQVEASRLGVNRSKRACAPCCCQTCQKMRTMVHIRLPLCLARSA